MTSKPAESARKPFEIREWAPAALPHTINYDRSADCVKHRSPMPDDGKRKKNSFRIGGIQEEIPKARNRIAMEK